MATASLFRLTACGAALTLALASCARRGSVPHASNASAPVGPTAPVQAPRSADGQPGVLASFASQPLILLPAQRLRVDVAAWTAKLGDPRAYLGRIDDEIAFAIRDRGLRAKWAFPEDLARLAKRNPGYAADPYTIALEPLAPVERDPEKIVAEPLAGQLRGLAGLSNARYALVPVELRLAPDAAGGRPTLHLVIIDTRSARLVWKGDITGDVAREFSPAVAAGLAGHVADLFIPPAR